LAVEEPIPTQISRRWREVVLSGGASEIVEFLNNLYDLKKKQGTIISSPKTDTLQRLKALAYLREIEFFEHRARDRLWLLGERDWVRAWRKKLGE